MELDDLKQAWKQAPTEKQNTNYMQMILEKSAGPVAELKRSFRKQIRLMAIVPFVLFFTNMKEPEKVLSSVLFWAYVAMCIGLILFASYNIRIVKKMEVADGPVKETIEKQVGLLEKRVRLEMIGMHLVLLFFVALVEILPYFQHFRMLDKWHNLPLIQRLGAYVLFFALRLILSRSVKQRRVGQHLDHLKGIIGQMQ